MTSKVEEVARAIFETWAADGETEASWDDLLKMQTKDGYQAGKNIYALALKEARAAIKAMRDLNDAMLKEAEQCGVYMPDFKEAWPNVIDAALGEEGR